jgi:hypothetical protein
MDYRIVKRLMGEVCPDFLCKMPGIDEATNCEEYDERNA